MAAISVEGLHKTYRSGRSRVAALDGFDLEVREGRVLGLLGPNGAGKTTLIRAVVGHLHPSAGRCVVLGADVPRALPSVIDRIGALVETPAFLSGMRARRILEILARSRGVPFSRIDPVLERVGLLEHAGRRVRTYSLGMRQRLGLAVALLKDPELVLLDEPANGLDPSGAHELRRLVRQLADEGRTVLISSHLLADVERCCDDVAVVVRGRCVAQGPLAEVANGASLEATYFALVEREDVVATSTSRWGR